MDWRYFPLELSKPAAVGKFIDVARESNIVGFNVTMPYKEKAALLMDRLSDDAAEISAVNTVKISDGKATGFNTDVDAIVQAFKSNIKDVSPEICTILGAGGVAKAAILAMKKMGISVVNCVNRSEARKDLLSGIFKDSFDGFNFYTTEKSITEIKDIVKQSDIIINATPVGMKPQTDAIPVAPDFIRKGQIVYDLIYNPPVTKLLNEAAVRGALTIGGLEVFVNQAMGSFEIWTGKKPPKGIILDTLKRELRIQEEL